MREELIEIIDSYANKVIIIEDEMKSKKDFKKFIKSVFNDIRAGFEVKELRECPVYFRFREGSDIYTMQLRHFLTNIIFWEPLIELDSVDKLDESFIIDPTQISSPYIKNYIDNKIVIPYRRKISNKKLNIVISNLIFNLSRISNDFNIIMGLSVSIESFIKVAEECPRFKEIITTRIEDGMQPNDIEHMLNDLVNEEIEILKTYENDLTPMLKANAGLKTKQLSEMTISGGLKPSLEGNTIPVPINTNFLYGGLNKVSYYFIDSIAGRKSLIMNKSVMGKSGYFARQLMLLSSNIRLRDDEKDCGSKHPIEYEIKTEAHLKKLIGRNYRLRNETGYKKLTGNEKHLIGEKILVRSPITCASKHGICKTCYGDDLFYVNGNGVGIGSYAAAIITNPLSQGVLSAKHILTTKSESIEFTDPFYKFFNLNANEITLNIGNSSEEDINMEDYSLLIIGENVVVISELDEGALNRFVTIFHVKNNKTGEIFEIHDKENQSKEFYLTENLISMLGLTRKKEETYEINLGEFSYDEPLFLIEIENSELTKPLYSIMGLLSTKKQREELHIYTVNDMAQRMVDLLIESSISAKAVHAEVIIHPLIRSVKNILDRPDFKHYNAKNDINILTVGIALEKHPSVLISLSSQFLGRQLLSPLTFKKVAPSFIDPYFRETP